MKFKNLKNINRMINRCIRSKEINLEAVIEKKEETLKKQYVH